MKISRIIVIIDIAMCQIKHLDKHASSIKLKGENYASSTESTIKLLEELKAVFTYEQHTEQPIENAGLRTSTPQ